VKEKEKDAQDCFDLVVEEAKELAVKIGDHLTAVAKKDILSLHQLNGVLPIAFEIVLETIILNIIDSDDFNLGDARSIMSLFDANDATLGSTKKRLLKKMKVKLEGMKKDEADKNK
jgi:hypothetical protein